MRIIYFTRNYSPHDARFLTALAGTPHEVHLMRLEGDLDKVLALPEGITEIKWAGGQQAAKAINYWSLANDLKRVVSKVKPDLIHAGPIQRVAVLPAAIRFHPLVSMSWGSDLLHDAKRSVFQNLIARFTLSRTSVMVGDCQAVSDKAQELGFPGEQIVLFPWGVDLKHFSPGIAKGLRKRLGWEKNIILLSNRSWEPLYGVDLIIKGFAKAVAQNPGLRLLLLGDGSQKGLLLELIATLNLGEKTHVGGRISQADLPDYYRASDLYISASHSDGSSLSLMEAIACGKPVIVSDIAGNLEWINDGENGWVFPDGDAGTLGERIVQAASLVTTREEFGSRNRVIAEERANWRSNFEKLLHAYDLACSLG